MSSSSPGFGFALPIAVLLVLAGMVLVFFGSSTGFTGPNGCVFWPFPLIISCGVGSSAIPLLTLGMISAVLLIATVFLWYRAWFYYTKGIREKGESPTVGVKVFGQSPSYHIV